MDLQAWMRNYLIKFPVLKQFIKFCVVGGIAALINFGVLYSFTEWLGIWYLTSAILGFLISVVFNFSANKFWTFRNSLKGKDAFGQMGKFSIVMLTGLTINTLIIYGLTEHFLLDYRLSWLFATGVVTFWNFIFNRLWTFKKNF
ncbi:MAG: GtrA family protein [Patescibacteria group bacterium]